MFYLMLFTYIIAYFYLIRLKEKEIKIFILYFIPIALLLILTLGLQKNVGTDYYSYINMVNNDIAINKFKDDGEILFYYLLKLTRNFKYPQLIFAFSGVIQVSFLTLIVFEIKKLGYKLHHFFFLYFNLSLLFFNQFNGIRQYISIYIIIYSLLKLREDKKLLCIILISIAALFHRSSLFFLIFVFINKLLNKRFNKFLISLVLISIFCLSFFDLSELLNRILMYIPKYSNYIGIEYINSMSFEGILTKLIKLIVVIYCLINIEDYKGENIFIINMSYIAIGVMFMSFASGVFWRLYQYFDIFLLFPVMMYMRNNKNRKKVILICLYLFIILIFKIILMPRGEYLYRSILF